MIPFWTTRVLFSARVLLPAFILTPVLAHFLIPGHAADIISAVCVLTMAVLGVLGAVIAVFLFIGGYRFRCPGCGGPTDMFNRGDVLWCACCGTIRPSGIWSYRVIPNATSSARWSGKEKEDGASLAFGIFFGAGWFLIGAGALAVGKLGVGKNGSGGTLTPEQTPVAFYSAVAFLMGLGLLIFALLINNARLRRRSTRDAGERRRILNGKKNS